MSERYHGFDWPPAGADPFDGGSDPAGRFYWAHGRPSRVFADDEEPEGLLAAIPMGYTSLSLLERIALFENGRETRIWRPEAEPGPALPLQPYQLLLAPTKKHGHQLLGASWPVRFALRDGLELSARTGRPVLVCRAISHQGWH